MGTSSEKILVVDDERGSAQLMAEFLRAAGHEVWVAHSIGEATQAIRQEQFAVMLCDIRLDHEDGTELLSIMKEQQPECLNVVITGFGSVDTAVRAIHDGAFDYLSKPLDLVQIEGELKAVVDKALKHREILKNKGGKSVRVERIPAESQMVGSSPAMVDVYRCLARASMVRENVLITGESGTGKELVARAIHEKGPWASKPFVTVNCCALAENLLESELFGHVRGAFTGAIQGKKGLFEEASGGTLFLDEIGDISLALQVKLLRAIQEGEIKAVGSTETKKVDVRVIAATHRDLPQYIEEGKFREDLYYRLKVISVEVPPLRDRKADIPDLVRYFASKHSEKGCRHIVGVSDEAMEMLLAYSWPGNIRELENAIGRAAAMTTTDLLFSEDFPPEVRSGRGLLARGLPQSAAEPSGQDTPVRAASQGHSSESLEELERRHIAHTLQSVAYNKSRAADILGIDRVTLYRKAFKYGLLTKGASRKESVSTAEGT